MNQKRFLENKKKIIINKKNKRNRLNKNNQKKSNNLMKIMKINLMNYKEINRKKL